MANRHPRGPRQSRPLPRAAERDRHSRPPGEPYALGPVTCPGAAWFGFVLSRVVVRNCIDDQSWSYRARCSQCDTTFVDHDT